MKNNYIYYIVLALFFNSPFLFGQQQVEFITLNHTKWETPCDVNQITVQTYGGGAGGGGVSTNNQGGGGGSGSATCETTFNIVTPGVVDVKVGAGGAGGNGNNSGSNGGDTWFFDISTIMAKGGRGGGQNNGAGGIAYSAANSIGDIIVIGGNGIAGTDNFGGAGGNNNGPQGGAGGAGATGNNNGANGELFGAGGGGAHRTNGGGNRTGGAGAEGLIVVFYDRPYCTNTFIEVEPITNVTFAGINNTTDRIVNQNPQNEYFCDLTANVTQGNSFPISMKGNTNGNYTNYFTVFIDWNQDGDFNDIGERYNIGSIRNSTGIDAITLTGNIAVPASALSGITKMRVVKNYGSYTASPCEINEFGQTEEYSVNVGTPVSCDPITATASDFVICAGDTVTLSASSTTSGYTYTWYTDWDNDTHTGTLVGTGSSINVNPTESTLYGVVATKTGCPTGVNAAYALIIIAVTPPPTLIVPNPVETIACTNEFKRIDVSGGVIPPEALFEDFDPIKNPWISSAAVSVGGNVDDAQWHLYASGGGVSSPDNSNFAGVNSAAVGFYQMVSSLNSPPISLLDYDAPINLTFNHYYRTKNNYPFYYSTATVEISTDGGLNWNILRTYTGSDVGGPTSFASETVNLNAYAGNPYVLLRFNYEGRFDWYWLIDDIIITGVPLPTNFEWTPYAGLYLDGTGTVSYNGENVQTVYASPSSTTTYTVNSSTAVGCPSQTTVTVRRGDKNWISPASTDWNIAANWNEGGIPTADHCVRIPSTSHKPIIDGTTAAFAKNVIIADGGGLTIEGGGSLTVTDYFNHLGTGNEADVVIKHNGNLLQINGDTSINSGEITVEKDFKFSAERKQYNYVTAPVVSGRDMKTSIYTPNPTSVQVYNTGNDYFYETAGPYVSGLAYAVKESPGSGTATVSGKLMGVPFNGPLNYTLNTSGNKFNLLGNPYPSNLDIKALYDNNNTKIGSTFYFWDNTGNTLHEQQGSGYEGDHYAKYNAVSNTGNAAECSEYGSGCNKVPDRNVKTGTGFMIEAISGTLNFTNAYRTTAGSIDFFGKPAGFDNQYNRYWLTLTSPSGIQTMMAVVYFDGGTDEFSADDTEGSGGSNGLYSILDTKKLNIQGRAPFRIEDQVPLGYKSFEAGTYIIEVYNSDGIFAASQNIYLIDKLLNKTVKITDKPYKFLTRAGQFNDRFVIVYRPGNIIGTAAEISNQILFAKIDNQIVITSTIDKITEVELFNLNSRSVYKKSDVNSNELRIDALNFNHQIVVVTVKTETGEFVTRKFVNN